MANKKKPKTNKRKKERKKNKSNYAVLNEWTPEKFYLRKEVLSIFTADQYS